MTLGERLKKARKNKKLTLVQVQSLTGTTQSYLSKLERGKRQNPSCDLLYELAKIYEVDFKWFVDGMIDEKETTQSDQAKSTKDKINALLNELNEGDLRKILTIVEAFLIN